MTSYYYGMGRPAVHVHVRVKVGAGGGTLVVKGVRWLVGAPRLIETLRCTKKPDRAKWCAAMPPDLWQRCFAEFFVPRPGMKEALELVGRPDEDTFLGKVQGRRVCFYGDSQVRHLYNYFVRLTEGYPKAPVKPNKEWVMPSHIHSYIVKRWAGFDSGVVVHPRTRDRSLVAAGSNSNDQAY